MNRREKRKLEKMNFLQEKASWKDTEEIHNESMGVVSGLFNRLGNSIDHCVDILLGNGDKFDRTFNEKEANDFLKKFK